MSNTVPIADQPDIWCAAALLLAQEGEKASEFATRRISEMVGAGNTAGMVTWDNILLAVTALRSDRHKPRG